MSVATAVTAHTAAEAVWPWILQPDRTDAVTHGQAVLTELIPVAGFEESQGLRLAAAVEHDSEQPFAPAIVSGARDRRPVAPRPAQFAANPGHGPQAEVEGRTVLLGNRRLMADRGIMTGELDDRTRQLAGEGNATPMYVAITGSPTATAPRSSREACSSRSNSTPQDPGECAFSRGMGMLHGKLMVG